MYHARNERFPKVKVVPIVSAKEYFYVASLVNLTLSIRLCAGRNVRC